MGAQPSSNGATTRGDASDDAADREAAPKRVATDACDIRDDYERVGVLPPSPSQSLVATPLGASGFLEILPPPAVRSESAIDAESSSAAAAAAPSLPGTSTPPNTNRSVVCAPTTAAVVDGQASLAPTSVSLERQVAVIPALSAPSEIKHSSAAAAALADRDASSAIVSSPIAPLPPAALPPVRSPSPPPRLIRALYGTATSTIDATQKLTRLLPWPIVLDRTVDPNLYFGADPQRGAPKSLWLILSQEDVRGVATRRVAMVLRERECRWDPNAVAEPELVRISA